MTTAEIPIQLLICSSFSMKLVIFLAVAHHNTHHSVVCLHVLLQRASIWHRLLRKNTAAHHCAPGTTRTTFTLQEFPGKSLHWPSIHFANHPKTSIKSLGFATRLDAGKNGTCTGGIESSKEGSFHSRPPELHQDDDRWKNVDLKIMVIFQLSPSLAFQGGTWRIIPVRSS